MCFWNPKYSRINCYFSFLVDKVIDSSSSKVYFPFVGFKEIKSSECVTYDKKDLNYNQSLSDMECSGFFYATNKYGIKEFIICLGYLGYSIKEYFININRHNNDFKIDIKTGQIQNFSEKTDDWIINLVDTGQETMTGGRLKKVKNLLDNEDFIMTYGDGVSDIDITSLINFHKNKLVFFVFLVLVTLSIVLEFCILRNFFS